MDRMNNQTWDDFIEDALRSEALEPAPPDFSSLVMQRVLLETPVRFQVVSWTDLILSLVVAICMGLAFLIPFLLPQQMQPWVEWLLQWGGYLFEKAVYNLPYLFLVVVAVLVIGGILVAAGRELRGVRGMPADRKDTGKLFIL